MCVLVRRDRALARIDGDIALHDDRPDAALAQKVGCGGTGGTEPDDDDIHVECRAGGRPAVDTLIASLNSSSATTADFVAANSDDVISLAADSREALEALQAYIPTVECFLDQIVAVVP